MTHDATGFDCVLSDWIDKGPCYLAESGDSKGAKGGTWSWKMHENDEMNVLFKGNI